MQNHEGLRNYRTGDNPEYDRMAAEACRAESKEAQDARLLREAPGMVNAYQPLFNDTEKAAPSPNLWRRIVAIFR